MIDGVVLGSERLVGESIGPMFAVPGVFESPQAAIKNARRNKKGKNVKRFSFMSMRPVIISWLIAKLVL
jgi:hypothetical protein